MSAARVRPWLSRGRRSRNASSSGQITGPLLVRRPGGSAARMIGIRFHPHTAGQLLQIPIGELTDRAFPLDELSPGLARELQRPGEARAARTSCWEPRYGNWSGPESRRGLTLWRLGQA